MAQIIHERETSDPATGIIAGVLIVLLVLALIWFFGIRPRTQEQNNTPGANINVTLPGENTDNTSNTGNTGGNTGGEGTGGSY